MSRMSRRGHKAKKKATPNPLRKRVHTVQFEFKIALTEKEAKLAVKRWIRMGELLVGTQAIASQFRDLPSVEMG